MKLIKLNNNPGNFTHLNLNYLLKPNYDKWFFQMVYSLKKFNLNEFSKLIESTSKSINYNATFRLEYKTMNEFMDLAKKLQLMTDTKV